MIYWIQIKQVAKATGRSGRACGEQKVCAANETAAMKHAMKKK